MSSLSLPLHVYNDKTSRADSIELRSIIRSENFETEFQWFLKKVGIWSELSDSAKASSTYDCKFDLVLLI